jgi:hypothetical protein
MPCEHYKDSLVEAAATGAGPQGELRAHLTACASCRAAYAEEQSVFASIDTGLRKIANTEIPFSLLPRVRAALDEESMSPQRWMQPLVFASASVLFVLVIFLVARPHRAGPYNLAKQTPGIPAHEASTVATRNENAGSGVQVISSNTSHSESKRNSTLPHSVASSQPEVLVPLDEREALARFVATVRERSDVATALLTPAQKKNDALVSLDPLQIADLELKPLEGTETEVSDREGEKH